MFQLNNRNMCFIYLHHTHNKDLWVYWVEPASAWSDSSVGLLADSQDVEGTNEPVQLMLLKWKMSPVCMDFNCFNTTESPAVQKSSAAVVPCLLYCFLSFWFSFLLIMFLRFAAAAESFFSSTALAIYSSYSWSVVLAKLKMYTYL